MEKGSIWWKVLHEEPKNKEPTSWAKLAPQPIDSVAELALQQGEEVPPPPNDSVLSKRLRSNLWPAAPDLCSGQRPPTCACLQELQESVELLGIFASGQYGKVYTGVLRIGRNAGSRVAVKVCENGSGVEEPWFMHHCQHPHIIKVLACFLCHGTMHW